MGFLQDGLGDGIAGDIRAADAKSRRVANNGKVDVADKGRASSTKIGGAPKRSEIDYSKTTTEMILNGTAVLKKDGRKVSWAV